MNKRNRSKRRKLVLVVSVLVGPALVPAAQALGLQQKQKPQDKLSMLDGDWAGAKIALRERGCCVVSVPGLESHVRVLQEVFANSGPADIDLRTRIHVRSSTCYSDCLQVRNSVVPVGVEPCVGDNSDDDSASSGSRDPCSIALEELARGMASLADGPLEGVVEGVFVRIVCASDYRGKDPPYHTDKAPLRGYVTLRGVGTEFMTRPCNPMEYMALRTLGEGEPTKSLRRAEELEFIVMKGDYYDDYTSVTPTDDSSFLLSKLWKRATACVHRSPPGAGGRRVIVSFDLADGDDDREWYQAGMKREWRSGMTQRKSRLVA